jgi:hypothetical protein
MADLERVVALLVNGVNGAPCGSIAGAEDPADLERKPG